MWMGLDMPHRNEERERRKEGCVIVERREMGEVLGRRKNKKNQTRREDTEVAGRGGESERAGEVTKGVGSKSGKGTAPCLASRLPEPPKSRVASTVLAPSSGPLGPSNTGQGVLKPLPRLPLNFPRAL